MSSNGNGKVTKLEELEAKVAALSAENERLKRELAVKGGGAAALAASARVVGMRPIRLIEFKIEVGGEVGTSLYSEDDLPLSMLGEAGHPRKWTEANEVEMCRQYTDDNKSIQEIADMWGGSCTSIQSILAKRGVKMRKGGPRKALPAGNENGNGVSGIQRTKIEHALARGENAATIATNYGVPFAEVQAVIDEHK